eukprot:57196-Pelagomonas_calceolata.AAC.2
MAELHASLPCPWQHEISSWALVTPRAHAGETLAPPPKPRSSARPSQPPSPLQEPLFCFLFLVVGMVWIEKETHKKSMSGNIGQSTPSGM